MNLKQDREFNVVRFVRDTYFWQRAAIFLSWIFIFYLVLWRFVSPKNPIFSLGVLLVLVLFVWTLLGVFRSPKQPLGDRKPMRPIWQRGLVATFALPLAFVVVVGVSTNVALAIKPYSASELAEQAAEEKAEKIREAAEAAKAAAEKEAAEDKAAADAAASADKAKREEAKKAAEEAANESSSEGEAYEARGREIAGLKDSRPLEYAVKYCGWRYFPQGDISEYAQVSDDGLSMFLTTLSGDDIFGSLALNCVAEALDFSQPLRSSIEQTNALMGTKTWVENKRSYEWSYHPEVGLNMSILREKECFLVFCN
jgi:hypothetical protein